MATKLNKYSRFIDIVKKQEGGVTPQEEIELEKFLDNKEKKTKEVKRLNAIKETGLNIGDSVKLNSNNQWEKFS